MKKTILLALLTLFSFLTYAQEHENENENENESGCERCRFVYGQWTNCIRGFQTRPYIAYPSSCIPVSDSIRKSCADSTVQYLYYNAQYQSIRVVSNIPGVLVVVNSAGTISRNFSFRGGIQGNWIDVADLPPGLYFASAYGKHTTFIR